MNPPTKLCSKCKEDVALKDLVLIGEPPKAIWICKSCETATELEPTCENCEE